MSNLIDKQMLARDIQGLLWNVLWLKGDDVVDLRTISDKIGQLSSKIEEDIFYHNNPDQRKNMNYVFKYLSK